MLFRLALDFKQLISSDSSVLQQLGAFPLRERLELCDPQTVISVDTRMRCHTS